MIKRCRRVLAVSLSMAMILLFLPAAPVTSMAADAAGRLAVPSATEADFAAQEDTADDGQITGILVNASVHGDGQKIDSISITVKDPSVLAGLKAGDFTLKGNRFDWAASFPAGADGADPMAYRTQVPAPFELQVTDLKVSGDVLTLFFDPVAKDGSNYKLYYVQNYALESAAAPALSFTSNQTATAEGTFASDNPLVTVATPTADEFRYVKTPKAEGEFTDFNYFLYTPTGAGTKPLPLLLSNHGSGDHMSTLANRVATAWAEPGVQGENPSYVLSPVYPQLPRDSSVTTDQAQDEVIAKTIALIQDMIAEGKVDPDRVYVEGKSMGGGNTIKIAYRYPDFFAAAMPLCGTNSVNTTDSTTYGGVALELVDMPIWFIVGEKDGLAIHSESYYNALIAAGSYKAKLKKYTPEQMISRGIEKPHNNEIISMEDPRHFEWMHAQKRGGANGDKNNNIDYIRVNTYTPARGHTIKTIDIYMTDVAVVADDIEVSSFVGGKITGNTYNYSSRALANGEYRTEEAVPFEATVTGVSKNGKKLTLTLDPIKGYVGNATTGGVDVSFNGFKKYYYVKDITIKTTDGAVDITVDRQKAGDTTAETADDFVQVTAKRSGAFDYYLYTPSGTVPYPNPSVINGTEATGEITKRPLVLYMHGSGDQGVLYANRIATAFAGNSAQTAQPAYVLAPVYTKQNDSSQGSNDAIANQWVTTEQTVALVERMIQRGLVDPSQVYLIGKSMGGKNVQRTYAKYPNFFAACVSLSGSIAQEFVTVANDANVTPAGIDAGFVKKMALKPFYIMISNGDPLTADDNGKTLQGRALRDAILAEFEDPADSLLMFKEYPTEELVSEGVAVKPHDVEILCMEGTDFVSLQNWMFTQKTGGNIYTVKFDADGGAPAPADQIVKQGGKLAEPAAPAKTGYTFAGWRTGADGTGSPWNFGTGVAASDFTLYASWNAVRPPTGVGTGSGSSSSTASSSATASQTTSGSATTGPTAPITGSAPGFADESAISDWAKPYIDRLARSGVMQGRADGTLDPKGNVTRAEFVKMIVLALDIKAGAAPGTFSDVRASDWFKGVVDIASSAEIVQGVSDGSFAPNRAITREDLATIALRALRSLDVALPEAAAAAFPDEAQVSAHALDAVRTLHQIGVVSGRTGGAFDPKAFATREETAKIIGSIMDFIAVTRATSETGAAAATTPA